MRQGNLFTDLPESLDEEFFDTLLEAPGARIERILSRGQATPRDQWYDQPRAEWVALLQGKAELQFEDQNAPHLLAPGDWILIPAHQRHRVSWTDPEATTIWLAVHCDAT